MTIKDSCSEDLYPEDNQSPSLIKNPNPQGKGACQTLGALEQANEALQLPAIHTDNLNRIVSDYLHSLLVLSCRFKFKPVIGKTYYIYSHNRTLVLSLVAPEDGRKMIYDEYIGEARLKSDFSWSLNYLETENLHFLFQLKAGAELDDDESIPENSLRRAVTELTRGELWRFNDDIGYYQNVMSFMLQKVLGRRLKRLITSGHLLTARERKLLDQIQT